MGAQSFTYYPMDSVKAYMAKQMTTDARIAVISEDLAEPWDEGIKNFAHSIAQALNKTNEVLLINIDRSGRADDSALRIPGSKTFFDRTLRRTLRRFSPEQILYVPSPSATSASFLRTFTLRRHVPRAAVGMVGLMPRKHVCVIRPFLKGLGPHVIFVPSYRSLLYFKRLSINAELISVGVDLERFRAAGREEKRALRKRYAFDEKSYIFLHVGHLSPRRNLSALLCLLQLPDSEIVLVGSTSTPASTRIRDYLESRGVRVIRKPVPVEDFYRLSDCYVFPAEDTEGAIELPLSIMEALASGLPVLSTPFGGLKDHLPEGGDIRFWNSEAELLKSARTVRSHLPSSVRSMEAFSWDMIAERMTTILGRTR